MKRFEIIIKIPCMAKDDEDKKILVDEIISKIKGSVAPGMTVTINEDYEYINDQ